MEVSIREFEPGDEIAFRLLNVEWITRYFELEAKDRDALEAPHRTILERGGRRVRRGCINRLGSGPCRPSLVATTGSRQLFG